MEKCLLCWQNHQPALVAREATGNFSVQDEAEVLDSRGTPHARFANFGAYKHELLLRCTEVLFALEPAVSVLRIFPVPLSAPEVPAGPAWPHTHTLDVSGDGVYVKTSSGLHKLNVVTINGQLQWQRSTDKPVYYVIERVSDCTAFAGALISKDLREGQITGLVFSPRHARSAFTSSGSQRSTTMRFESSNSIPAEARPKFTLGHSLSPYLE